MSVSSTLPGAVVLSSRWRDLLLWAIVAAEILILCIPGTWWGYAAAGLVAIFVLFGVYLAVLQGRATGVILVWLLVYPLVYHFFSFPEIQPIVTLDRIFIGILIAAACFANQRRAHYIPKALRMSALFWTMFLVFAAVTIPRAKTPLNSFRLLIEAFLFPALLGWYMLRYVDVRKHLRALHTVTCVMAIYVAAIGASEAVLQQDLLPLPDGAIFMAGDYQKDSTEILIRPNGPFSTMSSFAMVGLISFFFLLFLKKALGQDISVTRGILHRVGVGAALAISLMPLFRSVILFSAVVLMIDAYYSRGFRRTIRVTAIASMAAIFLTVRLILPAIFEERSSPENVYGRIAQQVETLRLFFDHPINGVGLNNYHEAAQTDSKYTTDYDDVESADYPHNNLGAVLSETGLAGFLPYCLSQVFLLAFWKIRSQHKAGADLAWKYFLFIFLGYWINGMALTTGYFADVNLWYLLVLTVVFKFVLTDTTGPEPAVPSRIFPANLSESSIK